MKKKVILSLVTVLLMLIFSIFLTMNVIAQDKPDDGDAPPGQPPGGKSGKHNFMERMKLTDDQKKKMSGIRQRFSLKMEDIEFAMLETRIELAKELKKDEPDREAVSKVIKKISSLEEKKLNLIIEEFFEVKKILTPEQRQFYMRRFIRQMTRTKSGMRK